MNDLSQFQTAQRLRLYFNESDRWMGSALSSVLLEKLKSSGLVGATLFRGQAGFGVHNRLHSTAIETLSMDLPLIIEVVDRPEKIQMALEIIMPMVQEGMYTVEDLLWLRVNKVSQTESWFNHSVAEVMTRNVVTLSADRSVLFAWQQMLAHVIKVMPVMDVSGGVIGILTDEDLLERAGVRQRLSLALRLDENEIKHDLDMLADSPLKVRDVMSQPVVTIIETDLLRTAIEKMVKHGLKRLPVLNSQLHLVGMLSRLDILRQVTGLQPKSTGQGLPTGAARTVGQVMTADIPTVQQDECLPEIINKLVKYNHTRLIVVDGEGKAIGLISDSDLISRIHPEKRSGILDALRRLIKPVNGLETAQDLMSPGVSMVGEDTRLVDAVQRMMDESRKWLVVVDQNVHPIGLLNRQILLESIAAYLRKTTQYQP